jgi:hypothetical protein
MDMVDKIIRKNCATLGPLESSVIGGHLVKGLLQQRPEGGY